MTFSLPKCKAICFYMPTPDTNLVIKGVPLQWVSHHMLLGIYVDTHLTLNRHIEYMQERIQKRFNTMRALTDPKAGANGHILQTVYLATSRSIIDYSDVA